MSERWFIGMILLFIIITGGIFIVASIKNKDIPERIKSRKSNYDDCEIIGYANDHPRLPIKKIYKCPDGLIYIDD